MAKYIVKEPFVINNKGEIAKKSKTPIELSDKQVKSLNLINRGKVEPYLTTAEKKEIEKQKVIEDDE